MKINKKVLISIIVFLIIVIIGGIIYINKNNNSSSFIFKIKGDFTSSGAQRNYDASLTFINNILVEGTESYYVGQGGGCTNNCERINSCKILNGEWVDISGKSNCKTDYPFIPSITKNGIERQIESKELKPINKCGHLDLCYEIIDISHINNDRP